MKLNYKLIVVGFILAVAILSSVIAKADQLVASAICEPFTISVYVTVETHDADAFAIQKLNEEASKRCYGHRYTVNKLTINRQRFQLPHTGFDPQFADRVSAKVGCFNQ